LAFSFQQLSGQNQPWRCVRNTNGIVVFSKKSPLTGIKIIKIETRVHTSLSALIALIKDAPGHKNWVFLNKSAKFLQHNGPFSWIYYAQSDAPWPVTDRDLVVQGQMQQDSITHVVQIYAHTISHFIPAKTGYVRIPYSVSQWTLTPEDAGYIHVEFKVEINLGGNIPKWLMNLTASRGPYESILALKKQLEKDKYKNAYLNYINEP